MLTPNSKLQESHDVACPQAHIRLEAFSHERVQKPKDHLLVALEHLEHAGEARTPLLSHLD